MGNIIQDLFRHCFELDKRTIDVQENCISKPMSITASERSNVVYKLLSGRHLTEFIGRKSFEKDVNSDDGGVARPSF